MHDIRDLKRDTIETISCFLKLSVRYCFQAIHLSFNEIISLERKLFKGLTNLNEILLEHNQISHIDAKVFKGLTYLNKINLSNNLISSIDPAVFASLNIRRIELNENYLSKECQFSLVRNLPKNVITAVRQKELSKHLFILI